MKVLFDTTVLVAGIVEAHPHHDRCLPWLQKTRGTPVDPYVTAHTLAELYAVLSSYPTRPRISPSMAARLVRENVSSRARVVTLTATDYLAAIDNMSELSLSGGVMYDALIVRAAQKVDADRLLTLNARDFLRIWPGGAGVIGSP
ncbi:MAG: PIN domain-containing protein [Vicinamibacteria bacterium]|nr:PIN domain-containing protein [Vicinamibacteria bacterium]